MKELDFIAKQVEVTALVVQDRITRVLDALYYLRDLTLVLDGLSPHDPEVVNRWLRSKGFGFDHLGYYERLSVLERARAGEVDPLVQIYYANEQIVRDSEALRRMHALRGFARPLSGITQRNPRLAWFYYQDATRFVIVYPMHDPCTVVPPDFDWHDYYTYKSVQPEVDPERTIRWTAPNIDYGGKGLMVAASIPVDRDDELYGVWSVDVPVPSLVSDALVDTVVEGQDSWLVDRDGVLLAHSSLQALESPRSGEVYRKPLAQLGGDYATLDLDSLWETGRAELVDAQGESRQLVARPIRGVDWLLVASFPRRGVLEVVKRSFFNAAESAREGDLSQRISAVGGDLQPLVQAFNEMSDAVESALQTKEAARRQLELSRNHARALFEISPVGLALVDADGKFLEVNRALTKILARNSHGVPSSFRACETRESAAELRTFFKEALRSGHAGPLESSILCTGNRIVPVRLLASRFEEDGQARVLLGVEDITERRLYQQQLLQSQKMQVVGRLAGGIAHDFNNLLTVIMSHAALQAHMDAESGRETVHLNKIRQAAYRASALTSQLLSFSRRDVVRMQDLDVGALVREARGLLGRLLDEDVDLTISVASRLPRVRGDEGQLIQVVMNLLLNARDALDTTKHIDVQVKPTENGNAIALTVTDTGVGMDKETRARVFEPFFTTKPYGTGLGLSTVQRIVEEMGGTISVESKLGEGSQFRLVFPATEKPAELKPRVAERVGALPAKVMLVDDDALVRDSAAMLLEHHGIPCVSVRSGREALTELEREAPDLLITDVVMPVMSGRELAKRARKLLPGLRVLYTSGYTDDAVLRYGVATNTVNFLRKPFTEESLLKAIRLAFCE